MLRKNNVGLQIRAIRVTARRGQPVTHVQPRHEPPNNLPNAMTHYTTKGKPTGLIRYVLLVVSHPEQPTAPQMSDFLLRILPEFKTQNDGTAKVGLLWETKPMESIDVPALAMQTFGREVADETKFTYRTLRHKMSGGETRCLVICDAPPSGQPATTKDTTTAPDRPSQASAGKWWQFWK